MSNESRRNRNANQAARATSRSREVGSGRGGLFVPRFAGEAFASDGRKAENGAYLRRLVQQVAWKKNPSADRSASVSG